MELEEFVTTTLLQIQKGINTANQEISKGKGKTLGVDDVIQYHIDRGEKGIKFDVAVTVSNDRKVGGGGKIQVAMIGFGGAFSRASKEERISRITFEVGAFKSVH